MKYGMPMLCVLSVVSASAMAQTAGPSDSSLPSEAVDGAPLASIPVDSPDSSESPAAVVSGSPQSTSRYIEEVVVTAQKREESLQSVPISIQAFSAEALDARGIEEPSSLQQVTPGMQYNSQAGYTQIYIRGVGTDAFIPSADATVATYIDNVYYPFSASVATALGAIERVEVLKGPQGTLFGRNSTGGAINIVMKQPGSTPESSVDFTLASYDKVNLRVYTSIPLSDTLAISVAGLRYYESSYYELTPQSPVHELEDDITKAFSLKAKWNPTDEFTASFGYSYTDAHAGTSMLTPARDPKLLGSLLLIRESPDYQTNQNDPGIADTEIRVATGDFRYEGSRFDTRLLLADQKTSSVPSIDFDGSIMPLVAVTIAGQTYDLRTAELQVLSNADSWGAGWLTWVGGIYLLESEARIESTRFKVGQGVVNYLAEPGALGLINDLTVPLIDVLSGQPLAGTLLQIANNGVQLSIAGRFLTQSQAAFFQTTADLTDWAALTIGGRYQTEARKLKDGQTSIIANTLAPGHDDVALLSFGDQSTDSSNFSPKVVMSFKPWDDALLYLSYTKGYKSGTYNIFQVYAASDYVKPEVVNAYEVGYKDTFFDGSMRFSSAIFENRIDNLQGQIISLTSGGLAKLINNGSARVRGVEFDSLWEVFPEALPGFVFTAGACYLRGTYTHYPDGAGYDETTGLFFDGTLFPTRDFTGNKTIRAPELSGNLGLSQTLDFDKGSVELATDLYYNSGFYFTPQNTHEAEQPSYAILGARVSYLHKPWNLRATLFGTNITDAKTFIYVADTDFATVRLLGPPSVYGLRLNWEF